MLRQRILTAAVGLPFLIAAVWFGAPWFTLLVAAVATFASFEFYRMVTSSKGQPLSYFGLIWVLLFVLSPHCPNINTIPLLMTSAIVFSLIWLLFRPSKEKAFYDWAWTLAGIFYVGWMLSYWVNLRNLEAGKEWVFWAFFITFATDTAAFFTGRSWGKHLMAQVISPGKTWEGAIGGLLAAIAVSLALSQLLPLPLDYWQIVLLGGLVSVFAQLGDLVESLLKRNMKVKDSGRLLPGHGGVLDRIDSIIFTGVVVYYYAIWIMK